MQGRRKEHCVEFNISIFVSVHEEFKLLRCALRVFLVISVFKNVSYAFL
jgi:hypothetical protein